MANKTIAYNKSDLRDVLKAFKLMDAQATEEARTQSAALAYFASEEIKQAAGTRTKGTKAAQRIADGVSISKSSKIGEFSYGFARQKFSGGATTQTLWGGYELVLISSSSSLLIQDGKAEVVEDGLSIQPFAEFSLN
jgi:hypothetical protein